MRSSPLLSLCLLVSVLPASVGAATTPKDLTPEEIQSQQWDTECRAMLPFGQGDLEAALLFKLRDCINSKQDAQRIAEDRATELKRLSKREVRETARREAVLARRRGASVHAREQALTRRTGQGTPLERNRRDYQRVHGRIRSGSGSATTGN